ncbi:hypothetical protein Avbf_01464 [Armadillidium vulgare]|nr:hypothetical protein Avbf_01464 [Armadillidium vulgare]
MRIKRRKLNKMSKEYITKLFGIKNCGIGKEVLHPFSSKLIKAKFLEEEDLIVLENLSPSIQELSSQLQENFEALDKDYCFPVISWNNLSCYEIFYLSLVLFVVVTLSFLDSSASSVVCFLLMAFAIVIVIRKNISNVENSFEESLCYGFSHLQASLFSYFKSLRREVLISSSKVSDFGNIHILFNRRYETFDSSTCNENTFVKAKAEKNKVSSAISAFWTETFLLSEILETLRLFNAVNWKELDNIKQQIKLLENNLNLSKNFWLEEKSKIKHLIDSPKSYEKLKTDVTGAVNTLSVKCRLLAYYSVHLQENLVNFGNGENLPFDYVRETCNEIRNHILSCNASLEDVLERTDNLYSTQLGCPVEEKVELDDSKEFNDIKSESVSLTNTHIRLNDLEPHVIQDEVFEAVIEDNQSRSLSFDGDEEWLQNLKQEKQMKKKQKDRCRRVLQEIQPILHRRRQMWEERESKALNRMRNIKDEDESSLNTKESDSGVSSPLEIPNVCFGKGTNSPELKSLVLNEAQDCDDYDSEEERLLVYKRVKRELDEDEERRRQENDTDSEDEEEENVRKELLRKKKSPEVAFESFLRRKLY